MRFSRSFLPAFCLLLPSSLLAADDKQRTAEQLAASARKSVVMILAAGRTGKLEGVGTGFIVGDGLIATNLHVIGEGRAITVQTSDGKRHEATTVHATDRGVDLAVIRADLKDLPALELGNSDDIKQGREVVSLGNPRGLEYSIAHGVVSARRDVAGQTAMIELRMPIEPGNSGGPLLDTNGRVQGVVTLKSAVTDNLGYATPINALKPLLAKPNPIPMARWLTIGALDADEWTTLGGAHWRQRAGRILVEGMGSGFGGRSQCLSKSLPPKKPFEAAVSVRFDDETGAAGLIFHADGKDNHYGFYPSGGALRFVRFEGPDVYSWHVLKELRNDAYHPGEWNTFKVRVEKDKFLLYCNGKLVHESSDTGLTEGKVGLASFRGTKAEFKNFQVGEKVKSDTVPAGLAERVARSVKDIPTDTFPKPDLVEKLVPDGDAGMAALRERARLLEKQAVQLRILAQEVHHKRTLGELAKGVAGKEEDIDLLRASLLIARLDNEELDVDHYRKEVDRLAREISAGLPKGADETAKIAGLNKALFQERGFHGSRNDYYHKSNSYLNEVIDDREGLPITLSVLYMELAKRLGLKIVGVGFPGHFIVRHVPAKGEAKLIDVYEGGKEMTRADAEKRLREQYDRPLKEDDLTETGKKAILVRMLQNLRGLAQADEDAFAILRYLDATLTITPDAGYEHWQRAVLRYNTRQREAAREDVDWLVEHHPEGIDQKLVQDLRERLSRDEK
jgi:regulator of sirC expression with transglutaminase-like and TPR domain